LQRAQLNNVERAARAANRFVRDKCVQPII
jgi:hypothetical protein